VIAAVVVLAIVVLAGVTEVIPLIALTVLAWV